MSMVKTIITGTLIVLSEGTAVVTKNFWWPSETEKTNEDQTEIESPEEEKAGIKEENTEAVQRPS